MPEQDIFRGCLEGILQTFRSSHAWLMKFFEEFPGWYDLQRFKTGFPGCDTVLTGLKFMPYLEGLNISGVNAPVVRPIPYVFSFPIFCSAPEDICACVPYNACTAYRNPSRCSHTHSGPHVGLEASIRPFSSCLPSSKNIIFDAYHNKRCRKGNSDSGVLPYIHGPVHEAAARLWSFLLHGDGRIQYHCPIRN